MCQSVCLFVFGKGGKFAMEMEKSGGKPLHEFLDFGGGFELKTGMGRGGCGVGDG